MKKTRTIYILFALALLGLLVFFGWKYIETKKDALSSLPLLKITLPDDAPPLERDKWMSNCNVRLYVDGGESVYNSTYAEIEGRGHSTFAQPKKPFNLKLDKKESLLGMPARERWVLLGCFFDHALMRNALGQAVARQTSLAPTTSEGRFVRLVINEEEVGVYYLCENVRDVMEEATTLLLEFDTYAISEDKTVFRTSLDSLPVSVRKPKKLIASARKRITAQIDTMESSPAGNVDFDTFADYFLVQELCQNGELNGPRSCYMHILPDGRMAAGPVWDFDLAFIPVGVDQGNDLRPLRKAGMPGVRLLTADSLYNAHSLWYGRLLQDSSFVAHVKSRWQLLKPRFEGLTAHMDSLDNLIRPSAIADQQKWNSLEPARFDTCTTYPSAFETLKATYRTRIVKLDSLVNSME